MRISRKLLAASTIAIAVLLPLAVLAQGWTGDKGKKNSHGPAWIALGSDAGPATNGPPGRGFARAVGPGKAAVWGEIGGLDNVDVDQIAERLGLTEEEKEKLEGLIDEATQLRDQLKDKIQEIRDLIGPKIREKTQEKREECEALGEEIKPIANDLRDLRQQLRQAVENGDEDAQKEIKAQIEEKKDELKDKMEELRESGCLVGNRWHKGRERIKDHIRDVLKRGCLSGLSDEDKQTLQSMVSDIREIRDEMRNAAQGGDQEKADELRDKLAQMWKDLRQFLQDKGVACRIIGRMPRRG